MAHSFFVRELVRVPVVKQAARRATSSETFSPEFGDMGHDFQMFIQCSVHLPFCLLDY